MKTIIFFLLISFAATAQTDTSRMLVRVAFMQKHLALMGAILEESNTLKDARLHDTLSARIYSGTNDDSVSTAMYPAGFVLKFFEKVADEQALGAYEYLRELINGKTGYTSIPAQLNTLSNQGNLTARWLRRELLDLIKRKEAPFVQKLERGAAG